MTLALLARPKAVQHFGTLCAGVWPMGSYKNPFFLGFHCKHNLPSTLGPYCFLLFLLKAKVAP